MPDTAPADDLGFDLPESWSTGARELFAEVLDARPDLSGPELGSLEHACGLTTAADGLDEVVARDGFTTKGSTGQLVTHPAVVEARLSRTAAAAILARLVPSGPSAGETTSSRARRAARARWQAK